MKESKDQKILFIIGLIPVIWIALLIAPSISGGLPTIIKDFPKTMENPFSIVLCSNSIKTILIFIVAYILGIGIYLSTKRNYRKREEHGSAKWGEAKDINKKYEQVPYSTNKILTQNVCIGYDGRKHRRNLNTLIIGGSGAGKTRFYAKPNVMQSNTSLIILDPKGEIARDEGYLLEEKGYTIKVLDLINMERSHCYNPFVYLQTDNDVQRLVTNLFKATTPKGSQSNDPFWDTKTALFAIIPDNDTSFNFLVSMLYTQLFQQLFYCADHKHGGRLPVHVHFLMDEFANVSLPDDFDKILSVMRSREVSVSIILQNLAQLKALFEKQWESIVGNCDEFLYLGGNEQSTHKYVSELLGKETIDLNTYGKSTGHSGNYSTNYQLNGRELLTPDEVRLLDNRYAILFIRGERPVMDFKYDVLKHPNVELSGDGKAKPYIHGEVTESIATIDVDLSNVVINQAKELTKKEEKLLDGYDIISSEEIDKYFKNKEGIKNEESN